MEEEAPKEAPKEALAATLSEVDHLRLQLLRERGRAIQGELLNLQLARQSVEGRYRALDAESKVFSETLQVRYCLGPGDEIADDGSIKRQKPGG